MPAHEEVLAEMNPYFLENEMPWRLAELRRDMERAHQLAHLLTRPLWTWRAGRRPSAACADVARAVEPGPA